MKILVAVKRVIDYNVHIRVKTDQSGVETDNVKMSMNPPDENAVEEAVRIKEAGKAQEIVVLSIGAAKTVDTLRQALAMGADRAIHIPTDETVEPLAVAKLIQYVADKEQANLILLGKQAIDDDSNQTGQMLAALMNLPQATFTSSLKLDENALEAVRETDEGLVTIKAPLPAVVSVDLRLNEPRFPSLPNLMKAKKKPLDVIEIAETGVDCSPKLQQIQVIEPPPRSKGIMLSSVDELVEKLKESNIL